MKISVVTISYNQARFLRDCLNSVAQQEGPWEHIIVDPGSTDGSRQIIEKHHQFSHVILEPDKGPADGLNRGFSLATGDLYYYLNSDDVVLPGTFAEARALFQRYPRVDVISGSGYVIDETGSRGRRLWSDPVSRHGLAHGGSILIQPSTFISRSAFEQTNGFNVANTSNWDGELIVDLFTNGATFMQVDRFWSGYRVHGESITGTAVLDAKIKAFGRQMFIRMMGKEPDRFAAAVAQFYRIKRILRHPEILRDRIRFGRVYGGCK